MLYLLYDNFWKAVTSMDIYTTSVGQLKGVGKVRLEQYARLGIHTVWDLLRHFPRAYENRGNVRMLHEACDGTKCSVVLTVSTVPRTSRIKGRMYLTKILYRVHRE